MTSITIQCTGVAGSEEMTLTADEFTRWMSRLERYGFTLSQEADGTYLFTAGGGAEYRWSAES